MSARSALVVCSLVLGSVSAASAQELWIPPTYQADFGGIGVGSNTFWPVTAVGAVRFAFAIPADLQNVRTVKVALIPHATGPATLNVYLCHAGNGSAVNASCSGPVGHPFSGVANQVRDVDITTTVGPAVPDGGSGRYVTVLAYTSPSTATDHFIGLRLSYRTNLFSDPGSLNTLLGYGVGLASPVGGSENTALGADAMLYGTSGSGNTAVGYGTLFNLGGPPFNTGSGNTGVGSHALHEITTGSNNTAVGSGSMLELHQGNGNSGLGVNTLSSIGAGSENTALGTSALGSFSYGGTHRNTAVGAWSLGGTVFGVTGDDNVAVGYRAGFANMGGSNVLIANEGGEESNTVRIGTGFNPLLQTGHTRTFVAGIRGVTTGFADAVGVVIDSAGQLGTISSSRRYKQDIEDLGSASGGLMRLRPVQFRYKDASADGSRPLEYGLIAEEVAATYPNLVVFDPDGRPETVQYHKLIPMLLNEMQKLQRQVDELKGQLAGRTPR